MCEALTFRLDNIYSRFGSKLYRHSVSIHMVTNCASLVADQFLFSYERSFMPSLSDNKFEIIEAFSSTSRYLDDLLNIDNNFVDRKVNYIYPSKLQLNKANGSDTEASFSDFYIYPYGMFFVFLLN